jgi:thiamine biosynthesis lipoprotein
VRSLVRRGLLLASLALLATFAAADDGALVREGSYVFGTRVEVTIEGLPRAEAQRRIQEVLARFDELHRQLHAWEPSEVTGLNAAIAAGQSFQASPRLAAMLGAGQQLTRASEGLFDPGIGKLVKLWGFQRSEFSAALPDAAAVRSEARQRPSLSDLEIGADGRISSRNRGVAVDLGGYAKGWALDEAAALLRAHGVRNALIDVGGNLMALGRKGERPWRVGIQDPRHPGALAALDLQDGEAIGTSGDYYRAYEVGGVRYAHIIDPRSGEPAHLTQSVTVLVGPREGAGALSDGASKPLFIAGPAGAAAAARRIGVTRFLVIGADGQAWASTAMQQRLRWIDPQTRPRPRPLE